MPYHYINNYSTLTFSNSPKGLLSNLTPDYISEGKPQTNGSRAHSEYPKPFWSDDNWHYPKPVSKNVLYYSTEAEKETVQNVWNSSWDESYNELGRFDN